MTVLNRKSPGPASRKAASSQKGLLDCNTTAADAGSVYEDKRRAVVRFVSVDDVSFVDLLGGDTVDCFF